MTSRAPASAAGPQPGSMQVGSTEAGSTEAGSTDREARTQSRPRRITSLDTVRGLLLLVNVAAISLLEKTSDQLSHAEWFGVTLWDLIFPLFVTFSGVGLAFLYRNAVGWRRTFRRSSVLLLVGLVYNMVITATYDLRELRLTGPLQVYAVLVLVIGILHLRVRTPRAWVLTTVAIAAAHAFALAAWQAGCPGGELLPSCNPSRAIDLSLLGPAHVYAQGELGHDPEGLVATLGALLTAVVGTTAGHIALRHRGTVQAPARLLGWSAMVMALAVAAVTFLPAMKRLWTTPFALGVAAIGIVVFAVAMAVTDLPSPRAWERVRDPVTWPLVALGRNSLLVYFGSHLVMHVLHGNGGETSWAEQLSDRVDIAGNEQATFMVFMVLCWVAVTAVLHKARIYLRP